MPEKPAIVMKIGNVVVTIGGGISSEIYAYMKAESDDYLLLEDGSKLMQERYTNA